MPEVLQRPITYSPRLTIGELVREINLSMRQICQQTTENYWNSYPQIDAAIIVNTTQSIWIPLSAYECRTIAIKTSSGTCSVTPRINAVNMGVAGGVPITATTTPTSYDIDTARDVLALDNVDCVVTGLTGAAKLIVALGVRRVG